MKTLILAGSPRRHGDSWSLLDHLLPRIPGEHLIVDAYRTSIAPCVDCRHCWTQPGCAIQDEMQQVYAFIQDCDCIIIASPIYFSELTGKLLDVGSRLQTYFCARFFRGEEPILKPKRGAVILAGGGDGHMDKPFDTACTLLHHMNCRDIHPCVFCHSTNERPTAEDVQALAGLESIASFLRRESNA